MHIGETDFRIMSRK